MNRRALLSHLYRTGAAVLALGLAMAATPGIAQVKEGGTMVVALPGDPPFINSAIGSDISSSNLSGQIYATIVRLDNNGKVAPYLAEAWEWSEDGLTLTFHLRDGLTWSDGVPFTAEDVAWGLWNVNREFSGPASGLLSVVTSIEAPDDKTVVFTLEHPYPPLLRGLAYYNSSTIIPKHIFEDGDPRENPANLAPPVGIGPFLFKEYQKGSHIVLEKNPDFFLEGLPHLDRVVFQIIPNDAARALALEKGEIDFIPYYAMTLAEVEALDKNPDITIATAERLIAGEYMAFLNTREGPLANKQVRQALYHALDRDELLAKAGFGYGKVAAGPISHLQKVFYSDEGHLYPHDLELAEKMLDEAGYPRAADGKRFPLRISYDQKEGPMDSASKLMRIQLAKVGVDVDIQSLDSGAWRDVAFKNWDFDVTMGSFSTGPDPAIGTERLYVCRNIEPLFARNASGYCNPELDAVFEAAAKELDEDKRVELYAQAVALLTEDAPHWWLWDRHYPVAFNANLTGLPADPTQYGPFDGVAWKE